MSLWHCGLTGVCVQTDAAVFRTQETLENGVKEIDDCVQSFEDVGIQDRSMVWNTDLCETLELENLLTNAAVTMHSAEARKVRLALLLCCSMCSCSMLGTLRHSGTPVHCGALHVLFDSSNLLKRCHDLSLCGWPASLNNCATANLMMAVVHA